jgi:hypothetical protein
MDGCAAAHVRRTYRRGPMPRLWKGISGPELPYVAPSKRTPELAEAARLADAEFRSRHPDCPPNHRFSVGDGPMHCSRCCPPPPLSPLQVATLRRIHATIDARAASPQMHAPPPLPRCSTCRQPSQEDHVCEIDDLPPRLQRAVRAIVQKTLASADHELVSAWRADGH